MVLEKREMLEDQQKDGLTKRDLTLLPGYDESPHHNFVVTGMTNICPHT
jgi:hypothetical protein